MPKKTDEAQAVMVTGAFHAPVTIALRTVGRWLHLLGISRLCDITPCGEDQ